MKRLFILLLATLMFAACLPTPEQEYVINKGDDVVEQKINATPKPAEASVTVQPNEDTSEVPSEPSDAPAEKQVFPDRWDEDAQKVNEKISIAAHADVLQRADGRYPVYRTKDEPMTEAEAIKLVTALLPKPTEAYVYETTKEDWKNMLQDYLDMVAEQQAWVDAGKPDWGDRDETVFTSEEIEEQTNWYMEQIKNAPDKLETKPVSDYSGLKANTRIIYTLESGDKAFVQLYNGGVTVSKSCTGFGYVYYDYYYEEEKRFGEPNAKLWKDVTLSREDAEATLQKEMERLGVTDYDVMTAEAANLFDAPENGKTTYVSGGWVFTLRRSFGGYPSVDVPYEPSQFLSYSTGSEFVANKHISPEQIEVFIDENGIRHFGFYHRKSVVGLENPNVELLPFERVQELAKNALAACIPADRLGDRTLDIEIYRMLLTTYTLHVKNSEEYYEMPCWVIFFDGMHGMDSEARERERNNKNLMQEALVLNAIDGSIVHTDYGY